MAAPCHGMIARQATTLQCHTGWAFVLSVCPPSDAISLCLHQELA